MLALRMLPSESAPHAATEASARMLELCLPAGTLPTRWNSAYLLELCLHAGTLPTCWNSAYLLELCLPAGTLPACWNSVYLLELCLQRTVVVAVLRHTDCEESGTSFADVTVSGVLGTSFTAACGGPGTS